MLFLEQNVDSPIGKRIDKWWAAYAAGGTVYLPLVMVDSGHQISSGSQTDFKAAYRKLVDPELPRPPQAELDAYFRRVGNRVRVYARLDNHVGAPLSAARNDAALHALVWEDKLVGVTGRMVRAAPWLDVFPEVAPEGSFTATLETYDLAGVNWNALHAVVVADYLPGPGPAYDTLQGALAQPAALAADPETVTVALEANTREDRAVAVSLRGPYVLNWTAVANVPWVSVSPDRGSISDQPTLRVSPALLAAGWQRGEVTFTASSQDGMSFAQTVAVSAFSGPRILRVGTATAKRGSSGALAVELSALGDENAVSFSLAFDPTVLVLPSVTRGADADAADLTTDGSRLADGRLGVSLSLPAGRVFEQGDRELAVISFTVAPGGTIPLAVLRCEDQPVERRIVSSGGSVLTATFVDGAVLVTDAPPVRPPRRRLAGSRSSP